MASVNIINLIILLVKHVNQISSNFTQDSSSQDRMTINVIMVYTEIFDPKTAIFPKNWAKNEILQGVDKKMSMIIRVK